MPIYNSPKKKTPDEYMKSPEKIKETFMTQEEEAETKFKQAKDWVGLQIKIEELKKYVLAWLGSQSDNDILYGALNSKAREDFIKQTIELYCWIQSDDIDVLDHYVTTAGGLILWFKTQTHIATAIYRAAPKIRSQEVQIGTFIPTIARERKKITDREKYEYRGPVFTLSM